MCIITLIGWIDFVLCTCTTFKTCGILETMDKIAPTLANIVGQSVISFLSSRFTINTHIYTNTMDRMHTVKEDDKMAMSWENNVTMLKAEIAKLARTMIQNGHTSAEETLSGIAETNPQMYNDEVFMNLFPIVFRIELCKAKKSIN